MQKRRRLLKKKSKLTHEDVRHLATMFGLATAPAPPAETGGASASSSAEAVAEAESDAKAASDE